MKDTRLNLVVRQTLGVICALLLLGFPAGALFAQAPAPPAQPSGPAQPLSPAQLDTLVAPIALYPDPLLSQVLVASTYPLEVVEAEQWLQRNGNLKGQQLMDAARQQNWDASVQALVAFPDVLADLNQDVQWTTALGNAFLAQQSDVMTAVQRMRARAQANGRLSSTPQQTVTTETQGGQTAIDIAPANPQVIYVPEYDPTYIWGPPVWGAYPPLDYYGYGFGFGPAIERRMAHQQCRQLGRIRAREVVMSMAVCPPCVTPPAGDGREPASACTAVITSGSTPTRYQQPLCIQMPGSSASTLRPPDAGVAFAACLLGPVPPPPQRCSPPNLARGVARWGCQLSWREAATRLRGPAARRGRSEQDTINQVSLVAHSPSLTAAPMSERRLLKRHVPDQTARA